jgi:hypothetical protein
MLKGYPCPNHAGHDVQDLGRQLFGMGALVRAVLSRKCLNTPAQMVDRPGLLSGWLGQHRPVTDVLPSAAITGSLYDESDHVVFEWSGTIDHLWTADASATT